MCQNTKHVAKGLVFTRVDRDRFVPYRRSIWENRVTLGHFLKNRDQTLVPNLEIVELEPGVVRTIQKQGCVAPAMYFPKLYILPGVFLTKNDRF